VEGIANRRTALKSVRSHNTWWPRGGFTELNEVWDKFHIYQGHRRNTAFIGIGRRHRSRRLKVDKHPNTLTQALHYRELL